MPLRGGVHPIILARKDLRRSRSLPGDTLLDAPDNRVVAGNCEGPARVQLGEQRLPERLRPRNIVVRIDAAEHVGVDRHARIRPSTEQENRLQQGGLACVVPAGNEVDPAQCVDPEVTEAAEIPYMQSLEHGDHLLSMLPHGRPRRPCLGSFRWQADRHEQKGSHALTFSRQRRHRHETDHVERVEDQQADARRAPDDAVLQHHADDGQEEDAEPGEPVPLAE